tara:strand:+ start:1702 stop:2100 length:399 start_codon:yes stop_codon:yes gene_type:complete
MKFNFNHNEETFSKSLSFINNDLPHDVKDAFNAAMSDNTNDCKSKILEATLDILRSKGKLNTPQDIFNAAFILGGELRESELHSRIKGTIDKIKDVEFSKHLNENIKHLKPEEIIKTDVLLENVNNNDPDEF